MAVDPKLRIGFALHSMGVAGAEVLVAEILARGGSVLEPTILCLDEIGELGHRLRAEGVEVIELGRRPGLDLRLPGALARVARDYELELIHAHQYTPFFYAALAGMRPGSRFKLILTEHGRHYPDLVSRRRRWVNRWLLDRRADAVTGCSDFSIDGLARVDGFSGDRIELIPNGVDLARYESSGDRAELRAELGLPTDRILIACVARFHPVKDHATLLRAFAAVAAEREDVDLLLVGAGPLRGDLERLTSELRIGSRVTFLGIRDDVARLMRAADIFCMTSLSEAASLTILEAMAAGLPVVVTDVGGNPELVRDGVEGRLAPRGNDRAIAMALLDLCENPERAHTMGAAARGRVEESFTLDATVGSYLDLYRRVCGR